MKLAWIKESSWQLSSFTFKACWVIENFRNIQWIFNDVHFLIHSHYGLWKKVLFVVQNHFLSFLLFQTMIPTFFFSHFSHSRLRAPLICCRQAFSPGYPGEPKSNQSPSASEGPSVPSLGVCGRAVHTPEGYPSVLLYESPEMVISRYSWALAGHLLPADGDR